MIEIPVNFSGVSPHQPEPPKSNSPKKKTLLFGTIALGVMLIAITGLLIVTRIQKQNSPQSQNQPSPSPTNSASVQNSITQLKTYLDKTYSSHAEYSTVFTCNSSSTMCDSSSASGSANRYYPLRAYSGLSQQTSADIQKINQTTEYLIASCNNNASPCAQNITTLVYLYNQTRDERVKNAAVRAAATVKTQSSLQTMPYAEAGKKLEAAYEITNDKKYRDSLITYADAVAAGSVQQQASLPFLYLGPTGKLNAITLFAIDDSLLPAFRTTQNEKYLQAAQSFLDDAKITDNIEIIRSGKDDIHLFIAADVYLQLAELVPEKRQDYIQIAHVLLQDIEKNNVDSVGNNLYSQDYGVVYPTNDATMVKSVNMTARLLTLYLEREKLKSL